MKYLFSFLLCLMLLIKPAIADEKETIFEGLGTEIVSVTDDMTDEVSGVIFVNFRRIYVAIYRNDNFAIWSRKDNFLFAFDSPNLIRVGKNKPFPLKCNTKRNGLTPVDPSHAESVIKSLVKGETVKLRYYDWPRYDKYDEKLKNVNLAYVYDKAVKKFGWKDFGVPAKLAPVVLSVYVPKRPGSEGYASVSVEGNPDLKVIKGSNKYGGGCYLQVGVKELFGIQKGKWCCGLATVDRHGKNRVIVRNPDDKIIFEATVPKRSGRVETGTRWPPGEKAAKAAWSVGSLGSIEIEGSFGKKALLYGFKELWEWGIENADLPPLK